LHQFNLVDYQQQPVFMVCTCGDNCGYADRIVKRILRKKSITLTNAYSVQMPNNYVLMSGFEVDSKEMETQKLTNAAERIRLIMDDIPTGTSRNLYVRGKNAFINSYLIYPLFRKQGIKRNLFHATNACISCGLCIEICPTKTIFWNDKTPKWEKHSCVQCSACINRCPERAIEYGKVSVTKGRYYHPAL
jgi:NAD-dependent dihydropyrimidine dehydrogenase PreA subunit